MSERKFSYTTTTAVKKAIPEAMIDEMVKRVVDKAYEKNLLIQGYYAHRFNLFTVEGKPANGGELIDAAIAPNSRSTSAYCSAGGGKGGRCWPLCFFSRKRKVRQNSTRHPKK